MSIIVVGLGPGDSRWLTHEAESLLLQASPLYLRTGRHPAADYLQQAGVTVETFDAYYESLESLSQVHAAIVDRLFALHAAGSGDLVFAVPGDPLIQEEITALLLARSQTAGCMVRLVHGMSFLEAALDLWQVALPADVQIVDGTELIRQLYPHLDSGKPAIISGLESRQMASDVKLALGDLYPDEHEVWLARHVGQPGADSRAFPLFELDRQAGFDHTATLFVPPLAHDSTWIGLQAIVARLRAPDGCPWDREQTHRTLRTHLLDETYEVLDALDKEDMDDLCGELGDLALQIALHVQIAREEGEFCATDVFAQIIAKLRRRHPHVFGETKVSNSDEVLVNWEQIKRQEKGARDHSRLLEGVPTSLPALAQALAYQERAARVGFTEPVSEAALCGRPDILTEAALGDLLFALVDAARQKGLNPETALREANVRFASRFLASPQVQPEEPPA